MKKFLLGISAFALPIIMYLGICISSFADIEFLYLVILFLFVIFEILYIPIERILKKKLSLSTEEYNTSMFIGAVVSLLFPFAFFKIMLYISFETKMLNARGVAFTTFFGGLFTAAWIGTIIVIRLIYEAIIRIKNRKNVR